MTSSLMETKYCSSKYKIGAGVTVPKGPSPRFTMVCHLIQLGNMYSVSPQ